MTQEKKIKKGKLIVTFLARNRNAQVLCEVSTRHFDTRAVLLNKNISQKNRVGAKERALRGSLPISQQPSEETKSARTQYSGNDVNC